MLSLTFAIAALLGALVVVRNRSRWSAGRTGLGWALAGALAVGATAMIPDDYALRKFLGVCLMPAGIAWLGLAGLGAALWRLPRKRYGIAAGVLWVVYGLAGNAVLGDALLGILERPFERIDPMGQGHFDAAIVLGGGVSVTEDGEPTLTSVADRVILAARLFRAGKVDTLICSGPFLLLPDGRRFSGPAATEAVWEELGVPTGHIVLLEGTSTTSEEIPAFRAMVERRGWRRVGLITSAWHLRRAMHLARKTGLEVVPLPAGRHEIRERGWRWIVPQEQGFRHVQTACWEFLGYLAGR